MSFWNFFSFGKKEPEKTSESAVTSNGAVSYSTTEDDRLNLFGKVCRDTPLDLLEYWLEKSWNISPLNTLQIIFYIRDCRGGTGERKQFFRALQWLERNHFSALIMNIEHVPFYGRYKDLLEIAEKSQTPVIKNLAFSRLALQLEADLRALHAKNFDQISLAAKYAPSENGYYDKKIDAVSEICKFLLCDRKTYRKTYLVPLRKAINVVETKMTNIPSDWNSIDFSLVPSVALKKYGKAWERHEAERFQTWLNSVKEGKSKMNVLRLMPHQIIEPYFNHSLGFVQESNHLVETQWSSFLDQTRNKLTRSGVSLKVVSVIDTSGSMFNGQKPSSALVAFSLGLALAELTEGFYKGKFITFSDNPTLNTIKGDTLCEKLKNISSAEWNMSTNIQKVFDLILEQKEDVDTVFVFSDMQFNKATNEQNTNWKELNDKYSSANRRRPRFVFWNLTGSTVDFPIPSTEENACYISGFSMDILKAILEGKELSPLDLMFSVIGSKRYSRLSLL